MHIIPRVNILRDSLELVPINQRLDENPDIGSDPDLREVLLGTIEYYQVIGFSPPWIGYFAWLGGNIVGSAGFKGRPVNNRVEVAYGTREEFRNRGIATEICRQMVSIADRAIPGLIITARTLKDNSHSAGVLRRNGFRNVGIVWDKDDGEVYEWIYESEVNRKTHNK
jgi:RimJ/RimL family protein N-acetyltransferase